MFGVVAIMTEFTSPLVNNRWYMAINGMQTTHPTLFLVNGVLMTILWFILRIVLMGWVGLKMVALQETLWKIPIVTAWSAVITYTIGYGLQVFWFHKILRGCLKVMGLFQSNKKSEKIA